MLSGDLRHAWRHSDVASPQHPADTMVVPEGVDDVVLWRVHVELEDRPGRLGDLATVIGAESIAASSSIGGDMRLARLLRRAGLRPTARLVGDSLVVRAPLATTAVAG